ncbi:MAG: ribosomal-processing cysteine protease Prp [Brevinematales bacterium]|nr:ribosomal-processing cysteine protease Prp [Brevinematales bacterium]
MIDITISETAHRLVACGHALFDEKGRDIVCAAVSVTLQGWVVGTRLLGKQDVRVWQQGDTWEARVEHMNEESLLLWKNMILMLDILSRQYPEYIRLHWEENHGS